MGSEGVRKKLDGGGISGGLSLGCGGAKSGGMVREASASFLGAAAISAPQWGQNRYFRVSTSGSCLLHLGQSIGMMFQVIVFEKG